MNLYLMLKLMLVFFLLTRRSTCYLAREIHVECLGGLTSTQSHEVILRQRATSIKMVILRLEQWSLLSHWLERDLRLMVGT